LRKNLAGEDGDPLAMACGPIFGIGIDNFATGEHTGQKRLPSRCPFRHPAVRRPYGLFQIVGVPRRPIAGRSPSVILNSRRSPSEAGRRRKDFIISLCFAMCSGHDSGGDSTYY